MTPREKAELVAYKLKYFAKVWYEQWRGDRPLERDLVDWEHFNEDFIDRFFPLDWR